MMVLYCNFRTEAEDQKHLKHNPGIGRKARGSIDPLYHERPECRVKKSESLCSPFTLKNIGGTANSFYYKWRLVSKISLETQCL